MVCAPVRSIIPSLKLGDDLSVQADKPCPISHEAIIRNPYTCNSVQNISVFSLNLEMAVVRKSTTTR